MIANGDERDRPAWWRALAGRPTAGLTAAALAVGLIGGYLAGHQQNRPPVPARPSGAATASPSPPDTAPTLTATGNRCAVQHGTSLQLGVEVANDADHSVTVGEFQAVLPVGGLRATAATVGTCGALPSGPPTSLTLAAGATEWLTITFRVLVRCPLPYPVQFQVTYTDAGKLATTQLDEFPDLGQVIYSGCPPAR